MTRFLLVGTAALSLLSGAAMAQTTIMTTPAAPVPPPPGTLSSTVTKHAVGPDGSQGYSQSTTYNTSTGVTNQTTATTVAPAPPPVTTQQTTTTTTTTQP